MNNDRPPRLRLIRVFLSVLVGFMAGLVGWTVVEMIVLFGRGQVPPGEFSSLPPALQVVAFLGPGIVAGYWLFTALGSSR
jgi:hypothetical protein